MKTTIASILSIVTLTVAKPSGGGEYSTLGHYGTSEFVADPSYQPFGIGDSPLAPVKPYENVNLQQASSLEYGVPVHEPLIPKLPFREFQFVSFKPAPPFFAPVPLIAKPFPFPVATIPLGWQWQGPGLF